MAAGQIAWCLVPAAASDTLFPASCAPLLPPCACFQVDNHPSCFPLAATLTTQEAAAGEQVAGASPTGAAPRAPAAGGITRLDAPAMQVLCALSLYWLLM